MQYREILFFKDLFRYLLAMEGVYALFQSLYRHFRVVSIASSFKTSFLLSLISFSVVFFLSFRVLKL